MEYKLCKDYDNMICCDDDCRRCANLVRDAMTNENENLKMRLDKLTEKCDHQVEAHNKLYDAYWRVKGERDKIHDELKELKSKKMVPLSEVYRIIAGHNDYHGGNILSALTCIAEGKYVDPVATYEPVNDALTDENKSLKAELKKFEEKCAKLEKENDYLDQECESLLAKFSERIAELEKENHCLDQECEKLRDDNSRLAHGFKDYIANTSELAKENDELRMMNDKLRTMNSDLLYRNGLLMKTTAPNIVQKVYIYDELNDKIESLKEDIIRLDKCLSKRQCVQLERIKEEHDGE